ncbi:MAG: carboxypeptidase regulatory-like domain-containing protein [Bryobacterales bacterium]|nr:carboxypeptidase regulatory-like domain-containing protein [Bryobacterales bacterium]
MLYPGTTIAQGAIALEIGPGTQLSGIDLTLPLVRVYTVSGKVVFPSAFTNITLFPVGASTGEVETGTPKLSAATDREGRFRIQDVLPGNYRLSAIGWTQPGSGHILQGRLDIAVIDQDITGLQVTEQAAAEVSASIAMAEGSDFDSKGFEVDFQGIDNSAGYSTGWRGPGEPVGFRVQPGRYRVRVKVPAEQRSMYVKSIRTDSADLMSDPLVIGGGETANVKIVVSVAAAGIAGVATDGTGKAAGGATVVVVPVSAGRADLMRDTMADQEGKFSIGSLAPGDYRVYAWEDVEPGMWWNEEFRKKFETQAERVILEAGLVKQVRVKAERVE